MATYLRRAWNRENPETDYKSGARAHIARNFLDTRMQLRKKNRLEAGAKMRFSAAMLVLSPLSAAAIDYPQEITAEEGTIVVYQPQPERLEGNVLSARAAMSLELKERAEPIFGAFWFDARKRPAGCHRYELRPPHQ